MQVKLLSLNVFPCKFMGDILRPNHNRNNTKDLCYGLISLALAGFLSGCHGSTPQQISPSSGLSQPSEQTPSSPTQAPTTPSQTPIQAATTPSQTAATISEIQSQPVWLRRLKAIGEIAAVKGMGLQIGETIRTGEKAMAQIDLKNGLSFRIGSNAVLTLQPDNSLNLSAGEMITWVTPGKHVPTKVITPGGIAGIRGTTIYIKMPQKSQDAIEFFTWEGTMFIKLPNQAEEFQLQAGEMVKIRPGETDIPKIRASIRRLTSQEWFTRRHKSPLVNNFDKPLPTLKKIDQTAPPGAKISSVTATPTPRPIQLSTSVQKRSLTSTNLKPAQQIIPNVIVSNTPIIRKTTPKPNQGNSQTDKSSPTPTPKPNQSNFQTDKSSPTLTPTPKPNQGNSQTDKSSPTLTPTTKPNQGYSQTAKPSP